MVSHHREEQMALRLIRTSSYLKVTQFPWKPLPGVGHGTTLLSLPQDYRHVNMILDIFLRLSEASSGRMLAQKCQFLCNLLNQRKA